MSQPKRIYLDHAATSHPKPPAVLEAMMHFARDIGASPGRGSYAESIEAGRLVHECRLRICRLINGEKPEHVIFTLNCSDALNMAIRGLLRPGDHVITTDLDHNSILRPLNTLGEWLGVRQTRIPCDPATGRADPRLIEKAIVPGTRLIAMLHGSNVTGTLQDVEAVGAIARRKGVYFLVDGAQTLGHRPVDVQGMNIDLLAAPGHKGLLGPLGTGFLYIRPGVEAAMRTSREGGTGSVSELDVQPDFLPDRFEPGSHNTIGILGLSEGVNHILELGIEKIAAHELRLMEILCRELGALSPALEYFGPRDPAQRCGVFSFRIQGIESPSMVSRILEMEHGILTRSGLHCAPGAHATIGTAKGGGATRLSLGLSTMEQEIRRVIEALSQVCRNPLARA